MFSISTKFENENPNEVQLTNSYHQFDLDMFASSSTEYGDWRDLCYDEIYSDKILNQGTYLSYNFTHTKL